MSVSARILVLHLGLLALLFLLQFVLPPYHHGNIARIMVLASYAIGYNILFGYTGLLSLGHALFFAAGMYGMGLTIQHAGLAPAPAILVGILAGAAVSAALALLALRTIGVAFMIVTLMFAQAGYLTVLYFGEYTRGDEGFVIQAAQRIVWGIDLSDATNRYFAAWALFAVSLIICLQVVRAPFGRTLVAIRENEERVRMLGYDTFAHKLSAMVLSGTIAAAAG
ncbi:MAG: branched-chain amino acid ABC transporter permease, partial [Pseudomonadota bacterium]